MPPEPMTSTTKEITIAFRLHEEEFEILKELAWPDLDNPTAHTLCRKIVRDWLKENGYWPPSSGNDIHQEETSSEQ